MKRALAAIVVVLVLLLGVVVWIGMSESNEPDAGATAPPPGPPRAVRNRAHAAADAAAPAEPEEEEAPPPADAASLAVHVFAGQDRKPLKGASVTVTDSECETWSVATDADGAALFATLPPGATEVRAESKGFLAATKTTVLAAKEQARAELTLERASALEGVLVEAATGAPIAEAEIEVVAKDDASGEERPLGDGRSDAKGQYRIDSLPVAGRVVIRVREPGRRPREFGIALGADAGVRIEVPREISGRLAGTVHRPDGLPSTTGSVALRRVAASPRDPPERVADCREDGAYTFDDIPLGVELVAVASAKSWADAAPTEPMTFEATAADRRHDFTLRRPATLTVNVPDPSTDTAKAMLVMVRFDDEDTASALSNGSGTVVRTDLVPGTHRVRVTSNGFLSVLRRVELPEGGKAEIDVVLVPGLEIRGRVLDAAGRGIPSAAMSAVPAEFHADSGALRKDIAQAALADERGEFQFTGLVAGRYRLIAYLGAGPSSAPQVVDAPASGLEFVLAPGTRISVRVVLPAGVAAPTSVAAIASGEEISPNLESTESVELRAEPRAWKESSTLEAEVAAGMKWLRILVPGCAPAVVPIRTDAGKTAALGEVRLDTATTVKGRVLDSKGAGLAGVSVWSTLASPAAAVRTGDDGSFEVRGLAPGSAIVRAQTEVGYGAAAGDAGGAPVTIEFRPFGTLTGLVTDIDGVAIKAATVVARGGFSASPLDAGRVYTAAAGDDGRFRVRVPSGRVRVSAGGEWTETTVPEGGEVSVTVRRP